MAEKIVSPGVFTRERDVSFLPQEIDKIGAALIGPTVYGQAYVPTKISTYSEYLRIFGDVFESGSGANKSRYKYLTTYAAQEYLRWQDTLTVVRVLQGAYSHADTYVISSGSYSDNEGSVGSGSLSFQTLRLHCLADGEIMNSGQPTAATSGSGITADQTSNGALASGSEFNIRWEIDNVNSNRGTFNLYIRRGDDTNTRKLILEQYNNISLDPSQRNYVEKVVGNQKQTIRFDSVGLPYLQLTGSYPNRSRYVRVEVLKSTMNYLDQQGKVWQYSTSASLPAPVSGTFANGSDGDINHPRGMYEDIQNNNMQGFNLAVSSSTYTDAINLLSNQDWYDINMLVMPGLIDSLTNHASVITDAIAMVEDRGDVFLVVDPTKYGESIGQAVISAEGRNSSYAAMYYPWVQVTDADLGRNVWVPPSAVIPGVIAFNDYLKFPWFAPAGLTRGPLDMAVQPERRLTHADRDVLYSSNVNPITEFPRDGVVIWGQKTLQKKRSALDRINVRRLLIKCKKFIASSSRYLVFEQNTRETRLKFLAIANPFFEGVKREQGLYDFKVKMDEENNTPEVIDRNELYGQIWLKPVRTAEFIIIDFTVLPTGATFPG